MSEFNSIMKISKLALSLILGLIFLLSCGTSKQQGVHSWRKESSIGNGILSGVLVVNARTKDTLFQESAHKLFIPASTTKILSLYTGLHMLPVRLPALKYRFMGDRTEVLPTGDPTQLHPYFMDSTALRFLSSVGPVAMDLSKMGSDAWAPGWAWEDYPYSYSPDRSAFPLYGNVMHLWQEDSVQKVSPKALSLLVSRLEKPGQRRDRYRNRFYLPKNSKEDTLIVPFITSDSLTFSLLENQENILIVDRQIRDSISAEVLPFRVLPGLTSDSLYKYMMAESDNFLAEQIMLMASSSLGDTLSFARARDSIIHKKLFFLDGKSRWVDGSGLSRYNLQSPANLVAVLQQLQQEYPESRWQQLLPAYTFEGMDEKTAVLKKTAMDSAQVFAKSGYVGNNYNLAGFLYTQKGELLVFAIMQNHYLQPTVDIRKRVASLLYALYQRN